MSAACPQIPSLPLQEVLSYGKLRYRVAKEHLPAALFQGPMFLPDMRHCRPLGGRPHRASLWGGPETPWLASPALAAARGLCVLSLGVFIHTLSRSVLSAVSLALLGRAHWASAQAVLFVLGGVDVASLEGIEM